MPVDIKSEAQLKAEMEKIIGRVFDNVSFKITLMLQRSIRSNVYQSHSPNVYYHAGSKKPTFEFLSAWDWKGIERGVNELTKEMFYNPEKMNNDPDTFLHGSNVPGWPKDAREFLASWLDKNGLSSSLWISVEHREFWKPFLDEVDGKIKNLLSDEFAKFGIRRN